MDHRAVRKALQSHSPASLLEQPESQHLEAKKRPYAPRNPVEVDELAKDICAFANSGGGVLVIGIATRKRGDEDVFDRFVPLERTDVDRDRYRKLIHDHICPAPQGVKVEWSEDPQGRRVLFIDVPEQPPNCTFVVAAPTRNTGPRPDTVAVPVRTGDSTRWVKREELQRQISVGRSNADRPTPAAGSALLRPGSGVPELESKFCTAYGLLASCGLGTPAGEAYRHGEVALQDFRHIREGKPGWTLCLVPDRPAVAVSAPVWAAVVATGSSDIGGEPLAAVGVPKPPRDRKNRPLAPWTVPANARKVDLSGGTWGPGRLKRSWRGTWQWEPTVPNPTSLERRSAGSWTVQTWAPYLRLRALVTLPWADASSLRISRAWRQIVRQRLRFSRLNAALNSLLPRRGSHLPTTPWTADLDTASEHSASYTKRISTPDGTPALTATAMITLPDSPGAAVVSCVDVRIEDAVAWTQVANGRSDHRLAVQEVANVLRTAWHAAGELLPTAVRANSDRRWTAPPTAELSLSTEQPDHSGQLTTLASAIELSALTSPARHRTEMAVRMTVPPSLSRTRRTVLVDEALDRMAREVHPFQREMELI